METACQTLPFNDGVSETEAPAPTVLPTKPKDRHLLASLSYDEPVQDFEKLGVFYLGKRLDGDSGRLTDDLILYDASDLTTHAVIIGMTGSGKTGLGIGLIEEAAIDHIPVIAIDPKGDLGNLLLSFPDLKAADFAPWVDARAAAEAGQQPQDFAAAQAAAWKKGLADWGQGPERIARLRAAADFALYTPGSTAGMPLSVLREFAPPPEELRNDADLYRERIQSTVTGLLTLLGVEADPLTSREHILISNVLDNAWRQGQALDLAALIGLIQKPPFGKLGVLDLESFYPAADRQGLALRLNNLLAAPGFEAWTQGEALAADRLLFTAAGQPRVSVISIAHLSDAQRMFFVTLLLAELIAWMRRQPGTPSLAGDPVHGRGVRLHAAGRQPAGKVVAADTAQTGPCLRAGRRAVHPESRGPRLQGPRQRRHLVHRAAADRTRQGTGARRPDGCSGWRAARRKKPGENPGVPGQAAIPAPQRQ